MRSRIENQQNSKQQVRQQVRKILIS